VSVRVRERGSKGESDRNRGRQGERECASVCVRERGSKGESDIKRGRE